MGHYDGDIQLTWRENQVGTRPAVDTKPNDPPTWMPRAEVHEPRTCLEHRRFELAAQVSQCAQNRAGRAAAASDAGLTADVAGQDVATDQSAICPRR